MRKKNRGRRPGLLIPLLFILLISFLLWDSNARIVVDDYALHDSRLPAAFDGYRIAQLSDIHAAVFGSGNSGLIDAVKKAKPDIIVITGDLINYDDDMSRDLGIVGPLVRSLTGIAPVYYVTGNHEWDMDWLQELLKTLEDAGVRVLRNDYERLAIGKASIILAGLEDPNGPKDMKKPEALFREIRDKEGDQFIIALEHRNTYLDKLSGLGVDLVLCGHAHGGIIRLPFFREGLIGPTRDWFPRYTGGVYTKGGTTMLVSRGIGNHTGVPRFLNNPEIPVIILDKK